MGKNTRILENVMIEKPAAGGKCIARVDNQVIFVNKVAPGDVVDIRLKKRRKNFLEGFPVKFHSLSKLRTEPFCSHFGICGGCKWQHISYETQLDLKQQQVIDQFERIGKMKLPEIMPIMLSENTRYYRNKLEFTFSNRRWLDPEEIRMDKKLQRDGLGFHIPGHYDKIVDIERCYLQQDPSNEIRNFIKEYAKQHYLSFYDPLKHAGLLRNLIIRTSGMNEVMVILQFGKSDKAIESIMEAILEKFPSLTSLNYIINPKKNETFYDLEVVNFYGNDHIVEELPAFQDTGKILKFKIRPKSFFQPNSDQALKLYQTAATFAELTGKEVVYDLYTGIGTIANFIAGSTEKVIGIESLNTAVEDARENAASNKNKNITFHTGDMREILTSEWVTEQGSPNVIIIDPPRAGMHKDVIGTLLDIKAPRIVYISCNPATQARDAGLLSEEYEVTKVQPVDMFPHTHHVENVIQLKLKEHE